MARDRTFESIRTEGGLLPADFLQRLANPRSGIQGRRPEDYKLEDGRKVNEAASEAWMRLQVAWKAFSEASARLPDGDPGTTLTRERWLLPLFGVLGYGRLATARFTSGDRSWPISHHWGAVPIHLVGRGVDLDTLSPGVAGAARSRPHSLLQEFLNHSPDHLWGFVGNGLKLRLLRDNRSLTRQAYVEFDLAAMMDGERYADFVVLFLVAHVSRLDAEKPSDCWLERWTQAAQEDGTPARDRLRDGVQAAIEKLGSGFLGHPANAALRSLLESRQLDRQDLYRQLLRLVYRLIFLFVAEDRDLLHPPAATETARRLYARYYSTRRLRDLAGARRGGPHGDLWEVLRLVMRALRDDPGCPELGLPALGSFLWSAAAAPELMASRVANADLLAGIRSLAYTQDGPVRRRVDFRNLGPEELGSIYEALLELHPKIEGRQFALSVAAGHERKTTGSYYTPASLISCLLDSALDPVVDEACQKPDPQRALLDLKVVDPACGSGHFLIAAAHRIARRLAALRTGEQEPPPDALRGALREVISHCIHGVDINPMAAELCKVNLWLEALDPGRPLSFLDHHIRVGNSLLGTTPALLAAGVPDEAFDPIEGDDKKIASSLKKQNKAERGKQATLFATFAEGTVGHELAAGATGVDALPDDTLRGVEAKASAWRSLVESPDYRKARLAADAWCAAFVWPKTREFAQVAAPTHDLVRRAHSNGTALPQATRQEVERIAPEYRFFHWHLAFPHVLRPVGEGESLTTGWHGGFDVVLGNPPWERVKLSEKEFFAQWRPDIAEASNAAARGKMIAVLQNEDPTLFASFREALRRADGESVLVRKSERYPLCGHGDVNTYAVFSELNRSLLAPTGRAGFIVPLGIVADDTTKPFFADLVAMRSLVSAFGFENEERVFPGVHHAVRFCLLTVAGPTHATAEPEFAFSLRRVSWLLEDERRFRLTADDIALLNPNTHTCPILRSGRDARIAKATYRRVPVLIDDSHPEGNPWQVEVRTRLWHMAEDAAYFKPLDELVATGYRRDGSYFVGRGDRYAPLYEAKMIHHFDHRFGTYLGQTQEQANQGKLPEVTDDEHACADLLALPYYWVPDVEVVDRLAGRWDREWLLGWRDICRSTDQRTVIATVMPCVAVGHTVPLFMPGVTPVASAAVALLTALCSFPYDYVARQKVAGTHLTYGFLKQLPVPPPSAFQAVAPWSRPSTVEGWLRSRVLELTYTAWDLQLFARDLGWDGPPFRWDPARRFLLRCELDAAFFHLYGIPPDDVDYIMDTFPIVRKNDEAAHGEYRTKRHILDIYGRMQEAINTGRSYQTLLDPAPAHPLVAHPPQVPEVPDTIPVVGAAEDSALVVFALLHASGGSMRRRDLAYAFAIRSQPTLLQRLAPPGLAEKARRWADKVRERSVVPGTMVGTIRALAKGGAIDLTSPSATHSEVRANAQTPSDNRLSDWYRFEARLALQVLRSLPAKDDTTLDAAVLGPDRELFHVVS